MIKLTLILAMPGKRVSVLLVGTVKPSGVIQYLKLFLLLLSYLYFVAAFIHCVLLLFSFLRFCLFLRFVNVCFKWGSGVVSILFFEGETRVGGFNHGVLSRRKQPTTGERQQQGAHVITTQWKCSSIAPISLTTTESDTRSIREVS